MAQKKRASPVEGPAPFPWLDDMLWNVTKKVAMGCWVLAGSGLVVFTYALAKKDYRGALSLVLLFPGSVMLAWTSQAQEGLQDQLADSKKKHQEKAEKFDANKTRIANLEEYDCEAARIKAERAKEREALRCNAGSLDVEVLTSIQKITTLIRSFTDAEGQQFLFDPSQQPDQKLVQVDVMVQFLRGIRETLEANIEGMDAKELGRRFAKSSITMPDLALLAAALCTNSEKEEETMLALLYFLLDPAFSEEREESDRKKRRDELIALVSQHLHKEGARAAGDFSSEGAVREEVTRLAQVAEQLPQVAADKLRRVPVEQSKKLVTAVLFRVTISAPAQPQRPPP